MEQAAGPVVLRTVPQNDDGLHGAYGTWPLCVPNIADMPRDVPTNKEELRTFKEEYEIETKAAFRLSNIKAWGYLQWSVASYPDKLNANQIHPSSDERRAAATRRRAAVEPLRPRACDRAEKHGARDAPRSVQVATAAASSGGRVPSRRDCGGRPSGRQQRARASPRRAASSSDSTAGGRRAVAAPGV